LENIAEALKINKSLRLFNLCGSGISYQPKYDLKLKGMKALAEALRVNKTLVTLDLGKV
jgi:hypothetical protein